MKNIPLPHRYIYIYVCISVNQIKSKINDQVVRVIPKTYNTHCIAPIPVTAVIIVWQAIFFLLLNFKTNNTTSKLWMLMIKYNTIYIVVFNIDDDDDDISVCKQNGIKR